jgi:hypothetical protein
MQTLKIVFFLLRLVLFLCKMSLLFGSNIYVIKCCILGPILFPCYVEDFPQFADKATC